MVTALIPARIGSRRLKEKNFLNFHGKPLAEWAILLALKCKSIDKIIFSTDNDHYDFKHPKVLIDYRDMEMRYYDIHTDDIYLYLEKKYDIQGSKIILEPTSPVRTPGLIENAINLHLLTGKSVVSVYEGNWNPNGVFYVYKGGNIYDDEVIPIPTPTETCIDIDHWYQFRIAEFLFKEMKIKELLE